MTNTHTGLNHKHSLWSSQPANYKKMPSYEIIQTLSWEDFKCPRCKAPLESLLKKKIQTGTELIKMPNVNNLTTKSKEIDHYSEQMELELESLTESDKEGLTKDNVEKVDISLDQMELDLKAMLGWK